MSVHRRQTKWIELERLRAAIKNAEVGIGTTMDPDDVRLTGKIPALELPKVVPPHQEEIG